MTNAERRKRLSDTLALLSVPGIGKGRYHRLVNCFGSPAAAIEAGREALETVPSITPALAEAIKNKVDRSAANEKAATVVNLGWEALYPGDDGFPERLAQIQDTPPVLFRIGRSWSAGDKLIAIVGTRHASAAGRRFTHRLAVELAEAGIVVVSGMAEGIDSASHTGALSRDGLTVAVWGRPLNVVYPECNRGLAEQISRSGTIYSEYPPGTPFLRGSFPERNRIIAGLCEGVVVVEAGQKSGALITAGYALEQGRELFAVPGSPDSRASVGCNELIKSGAKLLTSVQDIFDELPRLKGEISAKQFCRIPEMTESERRVVEILSTGPLQIDQMSHATNLSVPETMELLLALELKGVVQELSGKRFVLAG